MSQKELYKYCFKIQQCLTFRCIMYLFRLFFSGDRLNYVPRDDWDVRKSTEERLGWSEHKLHPLTLREQLKGRDAVGLPNWVRLQKQVIFTLFID